MQKDVIDFVAELHFVRLVSLINQLNNALVLVLIDRLLHLPKLFATRFVRGRNISTVCSDRVAMNGADFALAALKTGWQNVGQSELLFYLVDDLHVTNDLNRFVVNETVALGCFAFGWGVGSFAGEARVDPKVEQVRSERRT